MLQTNFLFFRNNHWLKGACHWVDWMIRKCSLKSTFSCHYSVLILAISQSQFSRLKSKFPPCDWLRCFWLSNRVHYVLQNDEFLTSWCLFEKESNHCQFGAHAQQNRKTLIRKENTQVPRYLLVCDGGGFSAHALTGGGKANILFEENIIFFFHLTTQYNI